MSKASTSDEQMMLLHTFAETSSALGVHDESAAAMQHALDMYRAGLDVAAWRPSHARGLLGEATGALGDHEEAEALLLESHAELVANAPVDVFDPLTTHSARRLVRHYERCGQRESAAAWRAHARELGRAPR